MPTVQLTGMNYENTLRWKLLPLDLQYNQSRSLFLLILVADYLLL